jgi:hypothetical protein
MSEGTETLNSGAESFPTVELSSSSASESTSQSGTAAPGPGAPSEETLNTGTPETVQPSSAAEPEPTTQHPQEPKQTPFHLNPAWQRIMAERDAAREEAIRAQAQYEMLMQQNMQTQQVEPDYVNITDKSPDELKEWFERDPIGYEANRARQVRAELRDEFLGQLRQELTMRDNAAMQQRQEQTIAQTFNSYAQNNPDFVTMWNNGTLQNFMRQNPGHNAISAHMALTVGSRIQAIVKEAERKKEEEVVKQYQAKQKINVIGTGPAVGRIAQNDLSEEMKNSNSYGGKTSVLARRLEALRRGAT